MHCVPSALMRKQHPLAPEQKLGQSIGQYNMYRNLLAEIDPERMLWLAVPSFAYDGIFREEIGQLMISRELIKLIVFDEIQERVRE